MSTGRSITRRDLIECRYALGDLPEEIAVRLRCSLTEVIRVGEAMDRAAQDVDEPRFEHLTTGRRRKCQRGHYLTEENRTTGSECRACKRKRDRARDQRERKAS